MAQYPTPSLCGGQLLRSCLQLRRAHRRMTTRRALSGDVAISGKRRGQMELGFVESAGPTKRYEYAALATTLQDEVLTIAQHYRDRADAENVFDELKNQWGWGGYTTKDIKRCRFMARIVGRSLCVWPILINIWRRLPVAHFCSMRLPKRRTVKGESTTITSTHGKFKKVQTVLDHIARFLMKLKTTAEQLNSGERWRRILSQAFVKLLRGKPLQAPEMLPLWCG